MVEGLSYLHQIFVVRISSLSLLGIFGLDSCTCGMRQLLVVRLDCIFYQRMNVLLIGLPQNWLNAMQKHTV